MISNPALRFALLPFTGLYWLVTAFRNFAFEVGALDSYKSSIPVISVGNLVVGGTGKSPLTIYIASVLRDQGHRPVILSRGYGGRFIGPKRVSMNDSAVDVGDEPLMHVRAFSGEVPVVIARRRVLGVKYIEKENLGNVVVLDDGFQHRRLQRDMDVVLVDVGSDTAMADWRRGLVLPCGPFRESKSSGLRRASRVVFTARKSFDDITVPEVKGIPCFRAEILPCDFVDVHSGEILPLNSLQGKKALVITAIAKPDDLMDMLASLGVEVRKKLVFRDHHLFSEDDWNDCMYSIPHEAECVITTAKDAVKLGQFVPEPGLLYALRIEPKFVGDDGETFTDFSSVFKK